MTRFILKALFFILPLASLGQQDSVLGIPGNTLSWHNAVSNTDSLRALLKTAEDHKRVHLLCELSYGLKKAKVPAAEYKSYLTEALELSEKLDYNHGRVMTLFLLADYYSTEKKDDSESLRLLRQSETFFNDDTHWTLKSRVWASACQTMIRMNQMDSAIFYSRKPLELLDKDSAWWAHLGAHQFLMRQAIINNDHPQKKEHFDVVISILESNHNYLFLSGFNLPSVYEELSIILANDGEYKRALAIMLDLLDKLNALDEKHLNTEFYIAKILGRIARIYSHWGRYDLALNYFNESIQYFDKVYLEYKSEIDGPLMGPSFRLWSINAVNQLEERAAVLIRTGELVKAREDLMQSIQVRTEHNDPLGVAMCYEKMGEIYAIKGKFLEALNWYNSALDIKTEMLERNLTRTRQDAKYMLFANESYSSTYLKMGKLYKNWDKPHLALEYYRQSLTFSREAGFQRCEAEALTALGELFISANQYDSTFHCYNIAKSIYEHMDYRPGLAQIAENIGDFYNHQNLSKESLESYMQSQQMFEQLDMPGSIAGLLIKQGRLLMNNQNLQQAIARFEKGLGIADEINLPLIQMDACQYLSEIYISLGNSEKVFLYYKKFREIQDELFTLETGRYLAEIEAQYQTEQSRQELLLLQSEKELMQIKETRTRFIIILMVAFIVIMLLWISLYLRHSRLKNGHEIITLQQKMFRSQLNPHFIFNSLGSIQSSILNEEPDKAVKYISRFSRLMRNILDSSDNELIPLSKEITTIKNYLELQKVRFTHKFDFLVSVDDHIDAENIFIPPMLAQPFIENAIEHGIKPMETKGQININIQLRNDILTIEIEDNGIGRKKAGELLQKQDKDHKSMAIDITRQRIEVINRKSKHPIRFEIEDLCHQNGDARGTRVVFDVPV
jgi:tetratricopeptide (TPR) repeat protein